MLFVFESGTNPSIAPAIRTEEALIPPAFTTELGRLASMHVILLGIPGAGKTTLAAELGEADPDINYISLGDISRELDPESAERKELDRLFAVGKPVGLPELFLDIVEPHVDRAVSQGQGFILDGIPKKVEEVNPLLEFMRQKDASPDLVISCELPPLTAYGRTIQRQPRSGDKDTTEIFLNRTKTYLRDLDDIKSTLTNNGELPLIIVDTQKHASTVAARTVIDLAGLKSQESDEHISEAAALHEAIRDKDMTAAIRIIGPRFDDTLRKVDHGILCDSELPDDVRQAYVEAALLSENPQLQETPLFLSRLARNYVSTTIASIRHIYESLAEEVTLRHSDGFTIEDVQDVFQQQLKLKELIEALQHNIMAGQNLEGLTRQEITANQDELKYIEAVLKRRAAEYGFDQSQIDILELTRLQPRLWGQLTSNRVLTSPDYNYRRCANGMPNSHHSLLPYTGNVRALSANSMGEYIPFIEAVSATENNYSSTFGFIHFVGLDASGEAYGAEFPIMMHDRRLLELASPTINEVLTLTDSFYGNHDLWHNLLPVYSTSFILHHPDAPLSYGGRLRAYEDFGTSLRQEKEEYEIGVAMAHARTQHERFAHDPTFRAQQEYFILQALDKLGALPDELATQCEPEEIDDIIDYLGCRAATKAYNIFPSNDPIYVQIAEKLIALGVKPMTISAGEVAEMLYMQGLFESNSILRLLPDKEYPTAEIKRAALRENSVLASQVINECIDVESKNRESGAEHIVTALEEWGVLHKLSQEPAAELDVIQKSRWLAMIGPQRQQLKGHMEKVHGKSGYSFGNRVLTEPRDLVLIQKRALDEDMPEYNYRVSARRANQRLSYQIYSLLFDDGQELYSQSRAAFSSLRNSQDVGQKLFAREAVAKLDILLNELVNNTYGAATEQLGYIKAFAQSVQTTHQGDASKALVTALSQIIDQYNSLMRQEQAHQNALGIAYSTQAQQLTDSNMTIS